jgi:hypothetical protein
LDEPSSKDVITKVKELNSSININAIDVNRSTFQYDTTYNEYTVKIVPVS